MEADAPEMLWPLPVHRRVLWQLCQRQRQQWLEDQLHAGILLGLVAVLLVAEALPKKSDRNTVIASSASSLMIAHCNIIMLCRTDWLRRKD